MTDEEIFSKLNAIFQDVFDRPTLKICSQTTANDVEGWDSLAHITLMSTVEQEFGIKFKMKDILTMKKIDDLRAKIQELTDK